MGLNATDFIITTDEVDQIFKEVTGAARTTIGVKLQVNALTQHTYDAVKAVIIEQIRERLRRSGKYLIDLLVKHDADKDNCLTYREFEDLLLDLPLSFKSNIFDGILIG
jgi:hypothetical protein